MQPPATRRRTRTPVSTWIRRRWTNRRPCSCTRTWSLPCGRVRGCAPSRRTRASRGPGDSNSPWAWSRCAAVLDRIRIRGPVGRLRARPDVVAADQPYSSRGNRAYLRRRDIGAVIPEKVDQAAPGRAWSSSFGSGVSGDVRPGDNPGQGLAGGVDHRRIRPDGGRRIAVSRPSRSAADLRACRGRRAASSRPNRWHRTTPGSVHGASAHRPTGPETAPAR